MSRLFGFAGKILYVDLNTGDVDSKPLDRYLAEKFIGGIGIGSWLAYCLIEKETAPLSPENVLVFSVSPLVGTLAPGASRVHVISKSPDSGFICYSNAGHSMGVMMKYAGYDVLIITGRAKNPVYLKISDDEVEICDARHLWGKDAWKTNDLIREEIGNHWVDCVGLAAESLVGYSIISCSKRSSFNKTGPGTVMGSKKLKAIVATGTRGVKVSNPEKFRRLTERIVRYIASDSELTAWRDYGRPYLPVSQPGYSYSEFKKRIAERPYACISCPVACKHVINLRDGPYKGLKYRVSHISALVSHNSLGGPENWDELVKVVELENRNGLEASVAAGLLSYLVECYEHNILTYEDIGFVPDRGGRYLRELIKLIVKRKGIGDFLADGFISAIQTVGEESEKYAKHHKGIGREHNLEREISIKTIGSLTNPRGGKGEFANIPFGSGNTICIERATVLQFCKDLELDEITINRVCDGPDGFNVGRLTKWTEDYSTVHASLGLCHRPIIMRHFNLGLLRELYVAATGIDMSSSQLLMAGERVFNVIKAFNTKLGATRLDDLPSRGATWSPDKMLIMAGKKYGTLNQILDQYYEERGWDVKRGIPSRIKLCSLGLQEVADDVCVLN